MTRNASSLPLQVLQVGAPWNGTHGHYDLTRTPINRIVLHTMVGTVAGSTAHFQKSDSDVSAHYGIGLDGKLYQWVSETATAYHAGVYGVNQSSIGIEHEDNALPNSPRADSLYATSAKLVADICAFYNLPINSDTIIRHNTVKNTACPDGLDTDRIIREAQAIANPVTSPADGTVLVTKSDFEKLVGKSENLDKIGSYLNFSQQDIDDKAFNSKAITRIQELKPAQSPTPLVVDATGQMHVDAPSNTPTATTETQGRIQDIFAAIKNGVHDLEGLLSHK